MYTPTFLERQWLGLFENSSYPALKLALVLFQIPFFGKYKIQDNKPNTPELYWKCVKSIIPSQIFVQLPLMLLFHPTAIWLGMRFLEDIHKQHHEFSAPFGIAAENAHPIETVVLGQGFFIGPVTLLMIGVDVHVVTMAIWLAVRLIETVDESIHKWMPFFGGADFHDYRHMAFIGNYSSSFRWWDWFFDALHTMRGRPNESKASTL
ncbi:hypothetical protein DFJ77DRAFT_482750 [Powellomyces hirtus]|nr:hypothetical protein DFJ77DRAFT_482750 [Powellomyces hirtus]